MKALTTLQSMAVAIFFMGFSVASLILSVASYFVKDGSGWVVALNFSAMLLTGLGAVSCYITLRSHLKMNVAPAAAPNMTKLDGTGVAG